MKNLLAIMMFSFFCCQAQSDREDVVTHDNVRAQKNADNKEGYDINTKTIHLIVALCDNQYQGIVPVPKALGNGQHPNTNLYWGAAYGVKTFFKKSAEWQLIESRTIDTIILERLVFKNKKYNFYLVADAYHGKFIQQATINFLKNSNGQNKDTLHLNKRTLGIGGNAVLDAYIGHDGLMDFKLAQQFAQQDKKKRDLMILACYSKYFFSSHLNKSTTNPLVWTSGLLAPEAYILHDALTGYVANEPNESIQLRAAKAYAKYQKCSLSAAKKLLVSGW